MAALIAVSVLPMLVTSQIAASVVSATYTENVETWLFQIGRFFLASVKRGGDEIGPALAAPETLHRIERMAAKTRAGGSVSHEQPFLDALGFDLLTLREPDGRLLYSNRPVDEIKRLPFECGSAVYLFRGGGRTLIIDGARAPGRDLDRAGGRLRRRLSRRVLHQGHRHDRLARSDALLSHRRRLSSPSTPPRPMPSRRGSRDAGRTRHSAARRLHRSDEGEESSSIGILIRCATANGWSASSPVRSRSIWAACRSPGTNALLWVIFATGMALAVVVGIALSGFVTQRVARLAEGVGAVAAGDFSHQIPVDGNDELDGWSPPSTPCRCSCRTTASCRRGLRRKERFATLGEVAAGFAHEVRNPLGIIKTTAELCSAAPSCPRPTGGALAMSRKKCAASTG